jgi:hypothetical protein
MAVIQLDNGIHFEGTNEAVLMVAEAVKPVKPLATDLKKHEDYVHMSHGGPIKVGAMSKQHMANLIKKDIETLVKFSSLRDLCDIAELLGGRLDRRAIESIIKVARARNY